MCSTSMLALKEGINQLYKWNMFFGITNHLIPLNDDLMWS